MAADVVDSGRAARCAGQVGELVIRAPWIGMTRGFWGDRQRYLDTYWNRWPGVWVHGDWAAVDEDGMWYILGRSDDTIKIAGKRLGPAEVESVLVAHPAVKRGGSHRRARPAQGSAKWSASACSPGATRRMTLGGVDGAGAAELGKPLKPRDVRFVRPCPRRATPRSCTASSAPPGWARRWATSAAWRARGRWRRSGKLSEP
jgi:acetyl-CoA synthetase